MLIAAKLIDVDGILRSLWASLCQLLYRLIAFLYELFMNIASVKLLTQDGIKPIYQRVTMILAIIMVFYVTFEVVKYVVQPETMTDKEKGATHIVRNMIIVVVLIAFVPLIFEKAYDLQNSLIKNQVFSKMILGKTSNNMGKLGREFSAQLFSVFYYYDEDYWSQQNKQPKDCAGAECETIVQMNVSNLASEGNLQYIHMGLNDETEIKMPSGDEQKVKNITFDGLLAVIVGGFVVYVLLLYCIDTGVRVVQLLFLQVIAPIPIIGYLAPKKDGIFQKWVKQCVTTYLDLFIRISIICFVLLIIETLGKEYLNGELFSNLGDISSTMRAFVYIAVIMGLLLFAQKAPKMLQELFPKMGSAAGNFGLKAGERVAPAAARTIGAGLGATRLLGGAIGRGVNTAKRNKEERDRTGMTRGDQRRQRKQDKEEMKTARNEYKNALRARNRGVKKGTFEVGSDEYNKQQETLQKKKDRLVETKSKYADDQNKKYRSVVGNALAGAAGGAYRGAKAGFGATKLEDIGKKVKEGYSADKKALDSREEWLNTGGYSNIQRTISGIAQGVGITTAAGLTEREMKQIDNNIKANETLISLESDTKSKRDDVETRLTSKLESGELKNKVAFTTNGSGERRIKGINEALDIRDDDTVSTLYGRYKAKADAAKSELDTAIKNGGDVDAAQEKYSKALRMEQAVKKHAMRNAYTQILQNPTAEVNDNVAVDKVNTMKTSIATAKTNQAIVDQFKASLESDREAEIKQYTDNYVATHGTEPPATDPNISDIRTKYDTQWDHFVAEDYEHMDYDNLDDIVVRLQNNANERQRQNMAYKESKRKIEASDAYAAEKADDKASGGNK